ncbi:MAG: hypothetical protein IJG00_01445 [Clostridia bacterium]|nr:hypothetical protein [Clostridia bacterium]
MEEIKNKAEKLERSEEEKVSGGYVHERPGASFPFVVVNDYDGSVIGRYKTKEEAEAAAKNWRLSARVLTNKEYTDLIDSGKL